VAGHVLFIEDPALDVSAVLDNSWLQALDITIENSWWESFKPDSLHACDLVVAVACSAASHGPLLSLVRQPRHTPRLAVLSDELLLTRLTGATDGIDDFVIWRDGAVAELRQRVERLLPTTRRGAATRALTEAAALAKLVGRDPQLIATLSRVPIVARSSVTALIVGETGTGKELCARAIHHLSSRRNQPFVPVDCGALPEQLLENELFGHVRGAFTDAHRDHRGLVAIAEGGTLFLDEVDSMAPSAQAKLLRLLESRTYRPLGASQFERADVRIVAATSAPLDELVHVRKFRADLFYRLNVVQLVLPPLRERRGDVTVLAQHFVDRICAESQVPAKTLAPSAADVLTRARWPGNVRELLNVIQHAVLFCDGPVILARHLPIAAADSVASGSEAVPFSQAKSHAVSAFERAYLEALLHKYAGNITRCAIEAKKDRRAFGRLVKKHHLDRQIG